MSLYYYWLDKKPRRADLIFFGFPASVFFILVVLKELSELLPEANTTLDIISYAIIATYIIFYPLYVVTIFFLWKKMFSD